jgi:hypothetical protein
MNDELVKYYKNKYEETLSKLNESEKTVKILNERIEAIERFSVSESDENDDTDDDDDYEEENNVKEKNNVEEDNDFSEEEIKKIKEKMLSFKHFRKSKSDFSSEEEYKKEKDLFDNNKQLLSVYSIEEVEECEKKIGFNLPVALKNYITKISREFIYNIYGFRQEIDLNNISRTDVSIYLNGESCSYNNKIYIQGNKKNKVASWCQTNYTRHYSSICANNFKEFVIYTLHLQKK